MENNDWAGELQKLLDEYSAPYGTVVSHLIMCGLLPKYEGTVLYILPVV